MLTSVKLYHKFCGMAIKIRNIIINYFLPEKTNPIIFQKVISKVFFFFGHVLSEFSCVFSQFRIVTVIHL